MNIDCFPQDILQLSRLQLRLDSQLYLLSEEAGDAGTDSLFTMEEAYAIKNGPAIINFVGSWSAGSGLIIPGLL